MKLNPIPRNILIIVVIAAAVDFLPGGGSAADLVLAAIRIAFWAVFAWVASRLYREHRITIYSLGTRNRTIAYVAIGAGILAIAAISRLWNTPAGSVAWIVVVAVCVYSLVYVYRAHQQY